MYEWEIRGGPTGAPVRWGDTIGLWNAQTGKYVVYGSRANGINLVWSGSAPPSGTTTATVAPNLRIGPFPGLSPQGCSGTVSWRFDPINLTGSVGRSTPLSFDTKYAAHETPFTADKWYCVVRGASMPNMRVGRWHMLARTPVWSATCDVDLHTGMNLINFTQNRAKCKTGLEWP